jgi:phage replication-related protein YjqB (UPF0714/DUF867 family)
VSFEHNSDLYAAPNLAEGVDYARRHRRHERFDDTLARTDETPKTVILAPHGGGIEPGTSELCLAVAGYHPANLPQVPPAGVTYDYWMFEGVREDDNRELHVTSTGCDDEVAVSLCAGSLNALALHGFSDDDQVVLVGGANPDSTPNPLRDYLVDGLRAAQFVARGPGQHGELNGNAPCNIVNRTMLGMGRAAGAQHAAARRDVHRPPPPAAQAHHHPAVLDLRGGVPRRGRSARGRAGRAAAKGASMPSRPLTYRTRR